MAHELVVRVGAGDDPRGIRGGRGRPVALAVRLGGPAAGQARTAFADGLHLALLIAAGIVCCAAIAVATLLRNRAARG